MKSGKEIAESTSESSREHYFSLLPVEIQNKLLELEKVPLVPECSNQARGVPNFFLRSALFGVFKRGQRKALKGKPVASLKRISLYYTGWQLDQSDFEVMIQALHLQNHFIERTDEYYVRFQIKRFLKDIGRQAGKSGREWLKDSLRRLSANTVEIEIEEGNKIMPRTYSYAGSLIDEFYYDSEKQTYFLKINPKLTSLFHTGWTQMEWKQRLLLKRNLAKWLHGFYISHRKPYPIYVKTLQLLCGSNTKRLSDFRRDLRSAMIELTAIGAITRWEIDKNDKIHAERPYGENHERK